jgi:glycolate oxidase
MALTREIYQVFSDIVGPENMTEEPVILDGYAFNWLVEFHPGPGPGKYMDHRPEAILLPGSVEEVQAVVRACNEHGVKYKAISTGYGSHGFPQQEGVVLLDLKRMNRIIEIDAKNKFAVVEPYVVWAQLEAEVLKRGLFTTPVQAGSQASVLANVTSGWGMNVMGNHGGHNGRNCLGVEWVLPTGELLRLGPEDAWYCGDGPGPSLRGIMRGHCGAQGGMGVFTKVGIKLHHWPGPPELPTEPGGINSGYRLKQIPENAVMYTASFKDYDALTNYLYGLGDAEIGYAIIRAGEPDHFMSIMAGAQSNKTVKEWHESGLIAEAVKQMPHPVNVFLFGRSAAELAYQEKVLMKVLEEAGGWIPEITKLPMFQEANRNEMFVSLIGNDTHFIHHGGGFVIAAGYQGTPASVVKHMGLPMERLKKKYIEEGKIVADGLDSTYHNSFDNNAYVYMELEYHYDAADPESVNAARRLVTEERDNDREEKAGFEPNDIALCIGDYTKTLQERILDMGPHYGNFHVWQEKIKRAFDPRDASDRSNYGAGLLGKNL